VIVDVNVGGRRRRVELNRSEQGWTAAIDGQPVRVDIAQAGRSSSLLIGDASHEVSIEDRRRGELIVHVDGVAVPVSVIDPRRSRGRADESGAGGGPRSIVSPMPGRVVKLLVQPGDTVSARQGLVVVEAMKMENELRAPADARVVDVRVTEGMSVEANAVLIVLE
jgi:biotin carboxyl carrier protein